MDAPVERESRRDGLDAGAARVFLPALLRYGISSSSPAMPRDALRLSRRSRSAMRRSSDDRWRSKPNQLDANAARAFPPIRPRCRISDSSLPAPREIFRLNRRSRSAMRRSSNDRWRSRPDRPGANTARAFPPIRPRCRISDNSLPVPREIFWLNRRSRSAMRRSNDDRWRSSLNRLWLKRLLKEAGMRSLIEFGVFTRDL